MIPSDREAAVEAVRAWYREHGYLPTDDDWDRAVPDRPCARTIRRRWGWRQLLADALEIPVEDVPKHQGSWWSHEAVIELLIEARERNGVWPRAGDWSKGASDRPTVKTVRRLFGSWTAAIRSAQKASKARLPATADRALLSSRSSMAP